MTKSYNKQIYSKIDMGARIVITLQVPKESNALYIHTTIRSVEGRPSDKEYQPYRISYEMSKSKDGGWCSVLLWRKCFGVERYRDYKGRVR